MQANRAVVTFLKKCYEMGKAPLWPPPQARIVRDPLILSATPAKASNEIRAKERLFADEFHLQGEISNGKRTKYAIADQDFEVNDDTWIVGVLRCGAKARVRGTTKPGIGKCATKITILAFAENPVTTH